LPLRDTVATNVILSRRDTRLLLRDWVRDHVPAGARVVADFDAAAALGDSLEGRLHVELLSANRHEVVKAWTCDRLKSEKIRFVFVSSSLLYGIGEGEKQSQHDFLICLESKASLVATLSPLAPSNSSQAVEPDSSEVNDILPSLHHRTTGGCLIRIYKID
jgi:hypothetical protein